MTANRAATSPVASAEFYRELALAATEEFASSWWKTNFPESAPVDHTEILDDCD